MKKTKTETLLDQYNDLAKATKSDDKLLGNTGINYTKPLAVRSKDSENLKRFIDENKGVLGDRVDIKKKVSDNYNKL